MRHCAMGNDNLDLVTVLVTGDTFALALAKADLDDAGIDALLESLQNPPEVVSGAEPREDSYAFESK